MSKTYGIVLIGCGHIGSTHMEDMYFRDGIQIVGVVDINEDRAALFAKKYGALSWNTDYKVYLDHPDVDIFIIATYTSTHLSILKDCLLHGKHVLCEKPLTPTLEEGREFVDAVRNSKAKVLVGHILRHNETYKKVKQMLKDGLIGSPIVMRMVQNHHTMDWPRYLRLLSDCPPIIDCGVHYIDVMQWFTGAKIIKVGGIHSVIDKDVPEGTYNYSLIHAWLSDGSVAYYEAGWGNTLASSNIKEFIGPLGRISITLASDRKSNREEGDLIEYYMASGKEYKTINVKSKYKPAWKQIQCLIKMIESDFEGNPTMEDTFSAFKVACAADKALREKTIISLSLEDQEVI